MKIIPLGMSVIDLMAFDQFAQKATDQSPIRHLDENKIIDSGNLYKYIVALEYFLGNKITRLSLASKSLNHIYISFGIEAEYRFIDIFTDLYGQKISVTKKEDYEDRYFIIISLTLKDWKEAIIDNCASYKDRTVRRTYMQFYEFLKAMNLQELFSEYLVVNNADGTQSMIGQ